MHEEDPEPEDEGHGSDTIRAQPTGDSMDDNWVHDFVNRPARYPRHVVRGDMADDPVHTGDLNRVIEAVNQLVDQLTIPEYAIRSENWAGLIVVYGMDETEPRGQLRAGLEQDGFTVTVRRNEYGTSLEVHPRDADLIMTRYDLIVNAIADALPHAATIDNLQGAVAQRLGHQVPTGLLRTQVDIFNMSLKARRQGKPLGSRVPEGMVRLVTAASESGVLPPLCTRLP